jgi:hypothetical protein
MEPGSCVHKSPPLVPVLSQNNPVHTTASCLRSILMLSTQLCLCLTSGVFPSGFPTNILYAFFFSSHWCYMPCPSQPPRLDHSNYTWRTVQVMQLLIIQFSPTSCHFISLSIQIFSSTPHSQNTLSLYFSFNVRDQVKLWYPERVTWMRRQEIQNYEEISWTSAT